MAPIPEAGWKDFGVTIRGYEVAVLVLTVALLRPWVTVQLPLIACLLLVYVRPMPRSETYFFCFSCWLRPSLWLFLYTGSLLHGFVLSWRFFFNGIRSNVSMSQHLSFIRTVLKFHNTIIKIWRTFSSFLKEVRP